MSPPPARTGQNKRKSGGLLETIKTVVYAVLIALAIRTFAYEPFNIPSGSMVPTLLVGDYLFVSKFAYGYSRYSLPFGLPLFSGRIFFHPPRRGDVAVFRLPTNPSVDYIKRIVGLPGDSIQVRHAILYINGKPCPQQRIQDYLYREDGTVVPVPQYIETLPNGVKHRIIQVMDRSTTRPSIMCRPGTILAWATIATIRRTAACFRPSAISRPKTWSGGRTSSFFRPTARQSSGSSGNGRLRSAMIACSISSIRG